jgi:hypothetical protein
MPADPYILNSLALTGNILTVDLSYSGGCEVHDFELCWDESYVKTSPEKITPFLSHNANNDPCDGPVTESLEFNLKPVRDHHDTATQSSTGNLIVVLDNQSVMYNW